MQYQRYKPRRPNGCGAFFDFASGVILAQTLKLKSCRIDRGRGRRAAAALLEGEGDLRLRDEPAQ
jgi:hypothetical protein